MTRTLPLFDDEQVHCSRSPRPESFRLEDDMSQVERSFLADLLIEDLEADVYWYTKVARQAEIIERFRRCGQEGRVQVCPRCALKFFSRFYCKARLCDVCARIYGGQVYKKVIDLIGPCLANRKKGWTVAMLTLSESTGKYRSHYPNREEYKRFNQNVSAFCRLFFGKFRGRFSRTGRVVEDRKHFRGAGTIGVNEFGQDNNNLHCHILLYGPWIPWAELQRAWVKITGGDTGCFIEPIRQPDKAAHYVAKYITKAPRFLDPSRAIEYLRSAKNTRRIKTGGIFYNRVKLSKTDHERDECPFCLVYLEYQGIQDVAARSFGLNLHHVRKNPDLYAADPLVKIARELPGGVTPVGLPKSPPLWSSGAGS